MLVVEVNQKIIVFFLQFFELLLFSFKVMIAILFLNFKVTSSCYWSSTSRFLIVGVPLRVDSFLLRPPNSIAWPSRQSPTVLPILPRGWWEGAVL